MPSMDGRDHATLRIGELARRTGVPADTLRAWERRYGLLDPVRTSSGQRLYTEQDERTITLMRAHVADGLSAAQAAQATEREAPRSVRDAPGRGRSQAELVIMIVNALDAFDEPTAREALDELAAGTPVDGLLGDVFLPYLRQLGERWARNEITVAQEHFASGVIRERLTDLSRALGDGAGPHALLACAPGELHDLGLLCFAAALRNRAWQVTVLGANTPVDAIAATATRLQPDVVIIAAVHREHLADHVRPLRALAQTAPLRIGGAGADPAIANTLGAVYLGGVCSPPPTSSPTPPQHHPHDAARRDAHPHGASATRRRPHPRPRPVRITARP